jgi:agmatine/peptidylarginine deiminase
LVFQFSVTGVNFIIFASCLSHYSSIYHFFYPNNHLMTTRRLLLFIGLLIYLPAAFTQEPIKNRSVISEQVLSPQELLAWQKSAKGFTPTDPPAAPVVNLAEFNHAQGVLVRYPFGIPISLIKEMAKSARVTTIVASSAQQTTVLNQYTSNGVNTANCDFLIAPSNSYWTRDYGPWFILDSSYTVAVSDFPYNRPSRPQDDDIPVKVAQFMNVPLYGMNVIHTGGNYMCDGMGNASSTDLVVVENPTQTVADINQKMKDFLGIDNYFIRPDPNGTYIDHIDCWSKFLDVDKILVRQVPSTHPQYSLIEAAAAFWQNTTSGYGVNYQVFRVNTPNDEPFTNSYILDKKVFVPITGSTTLDNQALQVYETAMPGYEIVGMYENPTTPWESTDALHCRTHEMADKGMLFVKHMPILTQKPADEDYLITALIVPVSGSAIVSDSTLIYYKVNNGSYQELPLVLTGEKTYTGIIPRQSQGSTVSYYLKAKDQSGRVMFHPYIGVADPHVFTVGAGIYPHIGIDQHAIDTSAATGNSVNADFTVENTGYADLIYTVEIDPLSASWLVSQNNGGILSPGANAQIPLILNAASLAVGTYSGKVFVHSNDPDRPTDTVMVYFEVNSGVGISNPEIAWLQNSPNPFQSTTLIKFGLTVTTDVVLNVCDIHGKLVKLITDTRLTAGNHSFYWDGTNASGQLQPEGVYVLTLETKHSAIHHKMLLVR